MKASVYIATSLDGFIARENGALDWLPGSDGAAGAGDEQEDYGYQAFMDSVDVIVIGRKTYEIVLTFGPWAYGRQRVVVMSRTLTKLAEGLPETVSLHAGSALELWTELEAAGARHLYVDGGKTIQGFLAGGLIDELIITRVPVLIGTGIPLFGPLNADIRWQHVETIAYKSGLVQSRYRRDE
ncbi:MAG: dihydrofolate reductase [Anaerolineales bacterium]|nr:dihydrofolate reductase [Anaerolineales bacterium]MCB8953939.1 dihydrofolate reductase [Ardenticatenales bacterium]